MTIYGSLKSQSLKQWELAQMGRHDVQLTMYTGCPLWTLVGKRAVCILTECCHLPKMRVYSQRLQEELLLENSTYLGTSLKQCEINILFSRVVGSPNRFN